MLPALTQTLVSRQQTSPDLQAALPSQKVPGLALDLVQRHITVGSIVALLGTHFLVQIQRRVECRPAPVPRRSFLPIFWSFLPIFWSFLPIFWSFLPNFQYYETPTVIGPNTASSLGSRPNFPLFSSSFVHFSVVFARLLVILTHGPFGG